MSGRVTGVFSRRSGTVNGVEIDWEWPLSAGNDKKDRDRLVRYARVGGLVEKHCISQPDGTFKLLGWFFFLLLLLQQIKLAVGEEEVVKAAAASKRSKREATDEQQEDKDDGR